MDYCIEAAADQRPRRLTLQTHGCLRQPVLLQNQESGNKLQLVRVFAIMCPGLGPVRASSTIFCPASNSQEMLHATPND